MGLPGLIALFLVLRAFIDGNRSDIRYAVGLVAIVALSLAIGPAHPGTPPSRSRKYLAVLVVLLPIVAIFPFTVVVLIFGKVDMAAFVFHLIFGIGGTPWEDILPYVFTAFILWLAFMVSYLRLMPHFPFGFALPVLFAAVIAGVNPMLAASVTHATVPGFAPSRTLLPELRQPVLAPDAPRPDLVILYLEGFDLGYMDNERFGDMAAPLRTLAESGTSFTNVDQVFATGWSLAGTIATQCGVPSLPPGATASLRDIDRIMPDLTCLPDILADKGYSVTYVTGTTITGEDMDYFGYGNYFGAHGKAGIVDFTTLSAKAAKVGDRTQRGWGIYDADTFAATRAIIDRKAASDQPFAVIMATMDTHGPLAIASPVCTGDGLGYEGEDMTLAVACTSQLAATFVNDLRGRYGNDLKIVVMSDHLNHISNLTDRLTAKPRKNTVILLDGQDRGRLIDRPASMLDIYPTLLDWLGFAAAGSSPVTAGLGSSLLSSGQTLIERHGLDEINGILSADVELAARLWRNADAAPSP